MKFNLEKLIEWSKQPPSVKYLQPHQKLKISDKTREQDPVYRLQKRVDEYLRKKGRIK